jgi:hypothetical protein
MHNTTLLVEQFLKRQNMGNHRTAPRFSASDIPAFKNINLVDGPEVKLINISRHGALIESSERISPGSGISLLIDMTKALYLVKGRVIHWCIYPRNDKETKYQSAIAFDEDFPILPAGADEDFTSPLVYPGEA